MMLIEKLESKRELFEVRDFCKGFFDREFGATNLKNRNLDEKVARLLGAKDFNTAIGLLPDETCKSPATQHELPQTTRKTPYTPKPKSEPLSIKKLLDDFDTQVNDGLMNARHYQASVGFYKSGKFLSNLIVFVCAPNMAIAKLLAEKHANKGETDVIYAEVISISGINLEGLLRDDWITQEEFIIFEYDLKCFELFRYISQFGWTLRNSDDEYLDFDNAFTIKPETAHEAEVTIDLTLSLSRHDRSFYILAGINSGDGMDGGDYLEFDGDMNVTNSKFDGGLTLALLNEKCADEIKETLKMVTVVFQK